MITLLFTKGKNPLSRLITWGMKEEVSHFAVQFSDVYVIHSNLKGLTVDNVERFLMHSDIVWSYKLSWNKTQSITRIKSLWRSVGLKKYDFKYFFFLFWEGIKYRFFGLEMDFERVSHSSGRLLCTEVAELLGITRGLERYEYSTPGRLMSIIKERHGGSDVVVSKLED